MIVLFYITGISTLLYINAEFRLILLSIMIHLKKPNLTYAIRILIVFVVFRMVAFNLSIPHIYRGKMPKYGRNVPKLILKVVSGWIRVCNLL